MVSLSAMKDQLLTLDVVYQQLEKTEPLGIERLDNTRQVQFEMDPDWAHGIDGLDDMETVGVRATIDGTELQLTKEAALQAGANFGLTAAYAKKIPASYTNRLLNYHYGSGMGEYVTNAIIVDGTLASFAKPTIKPFSNLRLLESAVETIREERGQDVEIFADYKFHNSLKNTNVRLILPTERRVVEGTDMEDVPDNGDDEWYAGVHLVNSLTGRGPTAVEGYLFRWWCTNGATTTIPDVVPWHRRLDGQDDGVYEWARTQVDAVLGGLDAAFDQVQALAGLKVSATNTADILKQIFDEYKVPVSQRDNIREALLGTSDLSMYTIMNAITQEANAPDLNDHRRDWLMRIGGAIPTETFDTVKAQVWSEGNSASKGTPNPYRIG